MSTNEVIGTLVRDLRPLAPLPLPGLRTVMWAAAAAVLAGGVAAALGLRADLAATAMTPSFQVHVLFLLVAAWGSAAAALISAVPGEPLSGYRRAAPWVALSGWCSWLGAEVLWFGAAGGRWWPVAAGWGCVAKSFAVGFLPGALLVMLIARAAPPDFRRTSLFAVTTGATVGALGVELTCPIGNPMHLLLWHAAPVAATVVVVAVAAAVLLRGFGRPRHRK